MTKYCNAWVTIGASVRQCFAPRVFGIISDSTNTNNVIIAEAIPTAASEKTTAACAPTPAAPAVWATVFKVKIAAKG